MKQVNSLESTLVHYGASAIGSIKLIFIVVHSILKVHMMNPSTRKQTIYYFNDYFATYCRP